MMNEHEKQTQQEVSEKLKGFTEELSGVEVIMQRELVHLRIQNPVARYLMLGNLTQLDYIDTLFTGFSGYRDKPVPK